jgi:plastocyanin
MVKRMRILIFMLVMGYASIAQAGDISVDQHNKQFAPEDIVLKAGDRLIFTNHDPVNHNIQVVTADGDAEDKGLQRPGEIVTHTFTKPGSYQVHCNIHPDMILMVTVK